MINPSTPIGTKLFAVGFNMACRHVVTTCYLVDVKGGRPVTSSKPGSPVKALSEWDDLYLTRQEVAAIVKAKNI